MIKICCLEIGFTKKYLQHISFTQQSTHLVQKMKQFLGRYRLSYGEV